MALVSQEPVSRFPVRGLDLIWRHVKLDPILWNN